MKLKVLDKKDTNNEQYSKSRVHYSVLFYKYIYFALYSHNYKIFGKNIKPPTIAEHIAKTKTAPADASFAILAYSLGS